MDAGQRAYRIARMTDIARWKARGAALLVEAAKEQDSRHDATMRGLLLESGALSSRHKCGIVVYAKNWTSQGGAGVDRSRA